MTNRLSLAFGWLLLFSTTLFAQTTVFTYQGKLADNGNPVTGNYDFEFRLFAVDTGGTAIATVQKPNVSIASGSFTAQLDFGACPTCFSGANRFLEISVRVAGGGAFTPLAPRQQLTSNPYAIRSASSGVADVATNATQLGGVAANQFVITSDARLTDARPPLAGSTDYIQNRTTQQALSNFNVSGDGTAGGTLNANIVNATTQFNLGGRRILTGTLLNTFAGDSSGLANTSGADNSFFGRSSGFSNTTGVGNSFFGAQAGVTNVAGDSNSFFGTSSGLLTTAGPNSFFGAGSGISNTSGINNSFFGRAAGNSNTTGSQNTFIGTSGQANVDGGNNTTLGYLANVSTGNLNFATAIGAASAVSSSNTIALGRSNGNDTVQIPGPLNVTGAITGNGSSLTNLNAGNITSGTLAINRGGTGLATSGASGNFLRSNGTTWTSSALQPSDIPGGSGNYIQNGTSLQSTSNYNISGDGTLGGTLNANIVNAGTQYNIVSPAGGGPVRIMGISGAGDSNTYVGRNTAFQNPTGSFNSLFGNGAGRELTGGGNNSFFGSGAGNNDQTGNDNAFFGRNAGFGSIANDNSFFGSFAGGSNGAGSSNAFFGKDAGRNNSSGSANSFFGFNAGASNTTEAGNTFIGASTNGVAGITNATAIGNRAFVAQSNSLILGSINGFNGATASTNVGIGLTNPSFKVHIVDTSNAGLRVQTNTVGGTVGSFGGNGAFNIDATGVVGGRFALLENGNVGIGLNNPLAKLHVIDSSNTGFRIQTDTAGGTVASFGRFGTFSIDSVGATSGRFSVLENGNVGIGVPIPAQKLTVSGAGITRAFVNSDSNAGFGLGLNNQQKWSVATVTGGNFQIFNDATSQNAFWIDSANNNTGIGTTTPIAKLEVSGGNVAGLIVTTGVPGGVVAEFGSTGEFQIADSTSSGGRFRVAEDGTVLINHPPALPTPLNNATEKLIVNGIIRAVMGGGGASPVCQNPFTQEIANCVSSIRFKENVNDFANGLNLIRRLRPVSFNWKQGGMADMGLIAEEVAKEEPLLATYDNEGEIQGVKYDRVGVVLINAVKEQQAQIERQEKLIEAQQGQIDTLKKLVCAANPTAELCSTNK